MEIAEFLLARVAEDEQVARTVRVQKSWDYDGGWTIGEPYDEVCESNDAESLEHIARWDPARVLAECEAKRRIVAEHPGTVQCETCLDHEDSEEGPEGDAYNYVVMKGAPCPTLRLLALPYADHADYREEWRP